jgi:hypothetical protein
VATCAEILNLGRADGQNRYDLQMSRPEDPAWTLIPFQDMVNGYQESPYFYPNAAGTAVVMRVDVDAPVLGGRPRIELREKELDGVTNKGFDPFTGYHLLHFRVKITHLPAVNPDLVVAQVHNGNEDIISVRTQLVSGTIRGRLRIMGTSITSVQWANPYTVGTEFEGLIEINNGAWRYFHNDLSTPLMASIAAGGTHPDITRDGQAADDGYYCKAGCYPQTTTDAATEYAEVELRDVWTFHTGYKAPAVPGRVQFRSATTARVSATASQIVISKPPFTLEGDRLVAVIGNTGPNPQAPPAGFIELIDVAAGSDCRGILQHKEAGASEGASYTFPFDSGIVGSTHMFGELLCYSGVDSVRDAKSNPTATNASTAGSTTSPVPTALAGVQPTDMVVQAVTVTDDAQANTPTTLNYPAAGTYPGWNNRAKLDIAEVSGSGWGGGCGAVDKEGATGTMPRWTVGATSRQWVSLSAALAARPAPALSDHSSDWAVAF